MNKLNCWEVLKCGREPGGENADELGICPATLPNDYDSINHGEHGGRFCWAISGTFCEGAIQGTYANKLKQCLSCEFLNSVHKEEGRHFTLTLNDAKELRSYKE